jgi:HPt (histidine-containing phosphotransfer) domain-containing protein
VERPKKNKNTILRQAVFLAGLTALLSSAGAYVWIQTPLGVAITLERDLAKKVGRIMTLDEVLTMSAKMAASSGNVAYEQRYNDHVEELDRLIKETVGMSTDLAVRAAAQSTDEANRRLVDMETRSFELNKQKQHASALALLESKDYQTQKTIYATGMTQAFKRLAIATTEQRRVVERWATFLQILALLSLAAVLGAWTLDQRERRRQAAVYAAELETRVAQRTEELRERNRSMRLVLDSVQQGLVGVDLHGFMSGERSAILHRWFGPVEGPLKLSDYVRNHDPAFAAWFDIGIEQVREGALPPEICLEQMPRQLLLGSRTLSVEFEPVASDAGCDGLLVIMADITAELERERVEGEQRDLIRVLELMGRDPAGFAMFLRETNGIVEELTTAPAIDRPTQARLVHTLKGNAAQHGMSILAGVCHDIESRLAEVDTIPARDLARLDSIWRVMKDRVLVVAGGMSAAQLTVQKSDYERVVELVGRQGPHREILQAMLAWSHDPIQARLERLADYARALAERLGKTGLAIECDSRGLRCDSPSWASFWSVCVHLIRNAVDHGIEPPAARAAAGKAEAGQLKLSAELDGSWLVVRIADDGHGIDWQRLAEKAGRLGLPVATEAEQIDALFIEGVSCRDDVTDISGRGVGMGAVKAEVERRGGSVHVHSRTGSGVTFELRLPGEGVFAPASASLRPSAPARPSMTRGAHSEPAHR